jgi:hypothetical protein
MLSLSELVLERYEVRHVDPSELFTLAQSQIARAYLLKENGPTSKPVSNTQLLGRAIVLYDTPSEVKRVRELLARIDVPRGDRNETQTVEYKPRFLSLSAVRDALDGVAEHGVVKERGLVVMNDGQREIDAALALLARIDVPEKQVLLTCQLVDVDEAAKGPALAPELADNLQKLLPGSRYTRAGLAMLKTSVSSASSVSVELETTGKRYRLAFLPIAFDEATGSLTVAQCSLSEERSTPNGPELRELFKTNAVLRGGEYTVLAATGATPRLLVLRVTPQP